MGKKTERRRQRMQERRTVWDRLFSYQTRFKGFKRPGSNKKPFPKA